MKKKLKNNFKDKRGRIVDIFTNQPKRSLYSCDF